MSEPSPDDPDAVSALWDAFIDPPDDARPRAWWHWMDGNVDPDGVERDLRWLHDVGVRGIQLFDGGMGVPIVVPEPVRPGSSRWREALDRASTTAEELGLEFAVATSSGWSASGGPWVAPQDAMKKVVWSEAVVEGRCDIELPPLPAVAGLFQNAPRWGDRPGSSWSTDWRVVAFPACVADEPLVADEVTGSASDLDGSLLTDGSFDAAVELPRDPDASSSAWIELRFDAPVTVRSVVVGLPGPTGFGAAPPPDAVLQAGDDGGAYRDIATLPPTKVPTRSATFRAVSATRFRLVLSGAGAAEALPPIADGVRLPPVLRRSDRFLVSEFALRTGARVHAAEVKAGFGPAPDYYALDTEADADASSIDPSDVHDLTALLDGDGRLRWDAPPGRWRVLRIGASLTGQTNGPALPDATGLEVDKLDGTRVAAYLERHLARFEPGRFSALLSDSIEAGPQNFTDDIAEAFRTRRGYDPTPWLPALAGFIVGGASESDRFLYDYRRTLTELLSTEYYGTLAAEAHRRGMIYYAEALEDGRPQLGDDLAMRAPADVPMGAMWAFDAATGPRPTYVADLKGASSVAHVHGRRWTGAEAFTSFQSPWTSTPRSLKHVADLQLALGVTRFCIHTSPHQPLDVPPPGIALAPFLGQVFTVNETWSTMASPWIDYLSRCSAVLSAGEPAVEIAVFVGEEAPVTGLFDGGADTAVPRGLDFDYVGVDGLALLAVRDGELHSSTARYRVLYLGGSSSRLTVGTLRRIETLLDQGATVVGPPPDRSPSLADDAAEFARLRDRIWASSRATGRVVATADLAGALSSLRISPELEISGAPVRTVARLVDGRRVTFVANPRPEHAVLRVTASSRAGRLSAWDPVAVRADPLTVVEVGAERISFELSLAPFGSAFLVPVDAPDDMLGDASARGSAVRSLAIEGPWTLHLPDRIAVELGRAPVFWTGDPVGARHFSGVAVYRARFDASLGVDVRAWLDFADVRDIARIELNGVDCGVVWTAPFRVEVTGVLRPEGNELEVRVANPWRNRLIAEASSPTGEVFAPMTDVFEASAAPLDAGLMGPVKLLVEPPPIWDGRRITPAIAPHKQY